MLGVVVIKGWLHKKNKKDRDLSTQLNTLPGKTLSKAVPHYPKKLFLRNRLIFTFILILYWYLYWYFYWYQIFNDASKTNEVQKPNDRTEPTQLKTVNTIMMTNPKERIKPFDLYFSNISNCFQWTATTSFCCCTLPYSFRAIISCAAGRPTVAAVIPLRAHEKIGRCSSTEGEKPLQLQKN